MVDTITVDSNEVVEIETGDVDIVTVDPKTLPIEHDGSLVLDAQNINFSTYLNVADDGDGSVTVSVSPVTGADANVVTGTAGTSGNLAQWNADGDAVDAGLATSNVVDLGSAQTITAAKTFTPLQTFSGGINFGQSDLDYYEEGLWTPVLAGATTAGAHTYASQRGTYIRKGSSVFATFDLELSAYDTAAAGSAEINGIPYAQRYGKAMEPVKFTIINGINVVPASFSIALGVVGSSRILVRYQTTSATELAYDVDDLATNNLRLRGAFEYEV